MLLRWLKPKPNPMHSLNSRRPEEEGGGRGKVGEAKGGRGAKRGVLSAEGSASVPSPPKTVTLAQNAINWRRTCAWVGTLGLHKTHSVSFFTQLFQEWLMADECNHHLICIVSFSDQEGDNFWFGVVGSFPPLVLKWNYFRPVIWIPRESPRCCPTAECNSAL